MTLTFTGRKRIRKYFGQHIALFEQGNRWNHEPRRPRKLLLHTREIGRLASKASLGGNTLVPLRLYDKNGKVKLELALAKGKRQFDKRETERQFIRGLGVDQHHACDPPDSGCGPVARR